MINLGKRFLILTISFVLVVTFLFPNKAGAYNLEWPPPEQIIVLSIEDAYELALKNSKILKKRELEIDRSKEVRDMSADNVRFTTSTGSTISAASRAFTGLMMADISWSMAKKTVSLEEDKIFLSLIGEYINVLDALEKLYYNEKAIEQAKFQWRIESLKHELGQSSRYQKSFSESSLKIEEQAIELAELDLDQAYRSFNSLLGLRPEIRPILSDIPAYSPLEIIDLEREVYKAVENNPNVWQAEQLETLAKVELGIYDWSNPMREPYKAKEMDIYKAELTTSEIKEQMRNVVRNIYNGIRQLEESYNLQREALEIAKKNMDLNKILNEQGMGTLVDVKKAELEVEKAEKELNSIIYRHAKMKLIFEKPWAYTG